MNRISRRAARKMFIEGKTIYVCRYNLNPVLFATAVNVAQIEIEGGSTREELFERMSNAAAYYANGRVAFYFKEE